MAEFDFPTETDDSRVERHEVNPRLADPDDAADFGGTGVHWQDALYETVLDQVTRSAKEQGMFPDMAEAYVNQTWPDVLDYIHGEVFGSNYPGSAEDSFGIYTGSASGLQRLARIALNFVGNQTGLGSLTGGGGGGGGGGGPTLPTADQIRANFDLNQLAQRAGDLWRGMLVEEPKDARGVARAYVEAVVKTRGQQKIDFDQFVRERIKSTPRYAMMSAGKPEGMDYEAYIAPFINSANQILGGNQGRGGVSGVIGNAAALGSDPQSFRERLMRSDTVTGSSNYINSLQEKTAGVSRILR